MTVEFSKMSALRIDLAHNLEAGFDNYMEVTAGGYADFAAPLLEDGETAPDVSFQVELMKRAVVHQRERLETFDGGVVEQTQARILGRCGYLLTSLRDALGGAVGEDRLILPPMPRGPAGRPDPSFTSSVRRWRVGRAALHAHGMAPPPASPRTRMPDLGIESTASIRDSRTEQPPPGAVYEDRG